jgi:hypothetical protein
VLTQPSFAVLLVEVLARLLSRWTVLLRRPGCVFLLCLPASSSACRGRVLPMAMAARLDDTAAVWESASECGVGQ